MTGRRIPQRKRQELGRGNEDNDIHCEVARGGRQGYHEHLTRSRHQTHRALWLRMVYRRGMEVDRTCESKQEETTDKPQGGEGTCEW